MKNLLISLILILANALTLIAGPVDLSTAQQAASNFLLQQGHQASPDLVYSKDFGDENLYRVFNFQNGFIIVSGDDRVIPILGYSTEHSFAIPSESDTNYASNFRGWMKNYEMQIREVIASERGAAPEIVRQWLNLLNAVNLTKSTASVVPPLLTSTWNQGWPYNVLCPSGTVTGCVATAMAQIMKYHNWPDQGLGSFSYDWGSNGACPGNTYRANFGQTFYHIATMPNSCTAVDSNVARLMYHCGVACGALFGSSTGVSYSSDNDPMTRAWVNYFRYAYSTINYVNSSNYTTNQWDSVLQVELTASRPIFYRGDGIGSHAWVCDGVNSSTMYHFNFGWGGSYNGYYALTAITPGGYNFTNNQHAIVGIKPNDGSTIVQDVTWNGTITKNTRIAVADGISLTVVPGTTVKFGKQCWLQVFGRLQSEGTSQSMIRFTAIDTTLGWYGLNWDNTWMNRMVMDNNDSSKLSYSQVEYSKNAGIYSAYFSKLSVVNCKINNNLGGAGGGLSIWCAPINIMHSEIYKNHALTGGGFFITSTGSLTADISENEIHDNIADGTGGGFLVNNVYFTINNNNIHHNQAPHGAGCAMQHGQLRLTGNKICNNQAANSGGGIHLQYDCYPYIVNNLIANNSAAGGGGMSFEYNANPIISNNDIVNNYASIQGGAINISYSSSPGFKNCNIYGNVSSTVANQLFIYSVESDPFFDHCNVQGGMSGFTGSGSGSNYTGSNYTSNIDLPPQFIAPSAGSGLAYNGLTANWQLQSASPCINAGDTIGVSSILPVTDLAGSPRITNNIVDIGAYEYTCVPSRPAAINGPASVVQGSAGVQYSITPVSNATGYVWSVPPGCTIIGPGNTSGIVVDFNNLAVPGYISVFATGLCGNSGSCVLPVSIYKELSLTLFLEGLYNGNGTMNQAHDENGPVFGTGIADKITVELHTDTAYHTVVHAFSNVDLLTNGSVKVVVPTSYNESYYITIRHSNGVATVSSAPVTFLSGRILYNFTDNVNKAFGSNMQSKEDDLYVFYGGDVNQDGIIDGGDMAEVENRVAIYSTGYLPEDINGDGLVDGTDMSFVDNNAALFIGTVIP